MLCEPPHDVGHFMFETSGGIYADKTTFLRASIFKIVWDTTRNHRITTSLCLCPYSVDEQAYGSRQDVEDMVLRVGVRAWTRRSRLKPPFGNRVSRVSLLLVCQEERAHAAHLVPAPLSGADY